MASQKKVVRKYVLLKMTNIKKTTHKTRKLKWEANVYVNFGRMVIFGLMVCLVVWLKNFGHPVFNYLVV